MAVVATSTREGQVATTDPADRLREDFSINDSGSLRAHLSRAWNIAGRITQPAK
jgi:hypothetical protein